MFSNFNTNYASAHTHTNLCEKNSVKPVKANRSKEMSKFRLQKHPHLILSVHIIKSGTSPRCNSWQLLITVNSILGESHPADLQPALSKNKRFFFFFA